LSKKGHQQHAPTFHQFHAGRKRRCLEEDAGGCERVEAESSNSCALAALAKLYNPIICGWWNYYGAFYPTAMLDLYMYIDRALERWARRKYKTLSGRLRAGVQWLRKMKDAEPQLFHHWRLVGSKVG
jgi:hypothetical protein